MAEHSDAAKVGLVVYANSMDAEYVWMTSGIRNDYFRRSGRPAGRIHRLAG